jgi:hypothetical protein
MAPQAKGVANEPLHMGAGVFKNPTLCGFPFTSSPFRATYTLTFEGIARLRLCMRARR